MTEAVVSNLQRKTILIAIGTYIHSETRSYETFPLGSYRTPRRASCGNEFHDEEELPASLLRRVKANRQNVSIFQASEVMIGSCEHTPTAVWCAWNAAQSYPPTKMALAGMSGRDNDETNFPQHYPGPLCYQWRKDARGTLLWKESRSCEL